jgi:hypothetical protein
VLVFGYDSFGLLNGTVQGREDFGDASLLDRCRAEYLKSFEGAPRASGHLGAFFSTNCFSKNWF